MTCGSALVEALASCLVVALALATLATVASFNTRALRLASDDTVATRRATSYLAQVRTTLPSDGTTTEPTPLGTTLVVSWQTTMGRGRPDRVAIDTSWNGRMLGVASADAAR